MPLPFFRPVIGFLCLCALLSCAISVSAQSTPQASVSLGDMLRQLTDGITALANLQGPLRLEFLQDAAFAAQTGKDWQQSFRKDIESRHFLISDDPAATHLRIGVAVTPTQLVLSAEIHVGERDEVRLLTLPRASFRAASLALAPVRLEKQLVYQSADRILDASSLSNGGATGMALLIERNKELIVLRVDAAGALQQSLALTAAGPLLSRDPHGELSSRSDDASVVLPGKTCQFSWSTSADPKCHVAKFTPRAATVLTPPCDAGGWKLLADGADWTTPELLEAVPDNSLQKGSAAIVSDFPGPILGMNGEQNSSSALVVTRNLRTGNYEVYNVSLACGH